MPKLIPKKFLKEFENSFLKINSRFKLHKFEFSILKWHFKTKISKIWNFHFQNWISDFILKNFPMFIPEIPIFNLKIRVWHFWTIFGRNRISKTKHRIWRGRTTTTRENTVKNVVNTLSKSNLQNSRQNPSKHVVNTLSKSNLQNYRQNSCLPRVLTNFDGNFASLTLTVCLPRVLTDFAGNFII